MSIKRLIVRYLIGACLLTGPFPAALSGQATDAFVIIDELQLAGNRWTRDYIIRKELDFAVGDTLWLHELNNRFRINRDRLLNTGLFNGVSFNLTGWRLEIHRATIRIDLVENWFWYPVPILELGDRSFNEWFYLHQASLSRLNLGIRFMHINLSGHSDKLKLTFNTGFTQKYELDYIFPYLNRNKNLGAYANILYITHKDLAFESLDNKLHFTRINDEVLLTRFRASVALKYRRDQYTAHAIFLEFYDKQIHDSIARTLNPDFFASGMKHIRHLSLNYLFSFSSVDKNIYPLRGYRYLIDVRKEGLGLFSDLNYLSFKAAWEQFYSWNDRFSSGYRLKGKTTANFGIPIPYNYLEALGYYDDVLSGYQLYVVDGSDYAYVKTWQKFKWLDKSYKLDRYMPVRQFREMPIQAFLSVHGDAGYVWENRFNESNPFTNRLLYGAGIGLDVIIYHNYVFSAEITVNHLGEPGIFLQGSNTFE